MKIGRAVALAALYINGGKGVDKKILTKRVGWFIVKDLIISGEAVEHNQRYYMPSVSDFKQSKAFSEMIYIARLGLRKMRDVPEKEIGRENGVIRKQLTMLAGSDIINS